MSVAAVPELVQPLLARGPARIREAFDVAREAGRAALITYLMAGFPDGPTALAAAEAAIAGGADLLEVGVPFSDPVADGPVVAAAGRAVISAGRGAAEQAGYASIDGSAEAGHLIAALRDRGHRLPVLAMSYLDPLVARGAPVVLSELAAAGADGLIVPDLPVGEDPRFERLANKLDLGLCFLVAPNTTPARVELAIRGSTGFLYVVPLYGVTGARDALADQSLPLLRRVRAAAAARVPIVAGFGISRAEHVRALSVVADGVVVGSALLTALQDGGPTGPARVGALVRELASGLGRS